jgi:hypothetical protein
MWMFMGSHANCMMFERTSAAAVAKGTMPPASGPRAA